MSPDPLQKIARDILSRNLRQFAEEAVDGPEGALVSEEVALSAITDALRQGAQLGEQEGARR